MCALHICIAYFRAVVQFAYTCVCLCVCFAVFVYLFYAVFCLLFCIVQIHTRNVAVAASLVVVVYDAVVIFVAVFRISYVCQALCRLCCMP